MFRLSTVWDHSLNKRVAAFVAALLFLIVALPLPLLSESQLAENSPFLPPGHGKEKEVPKQPEIQPQGPISRELEFRGLMRMNGEFQVSIFNKKDQKSYWLKENEKEDGISVRSFNPETSSVVINMNGRSEQLELMEATDSPMPVTQSSVPSARKPGIPPKVDSKSTTRRTVVPRRRVILPQKK